MTPRALGVRALAAALALLGSVALAGCAGMIAERIVAAPNHGEPTDDPRAKDAAPLLAKLYAQRGEVAVTTPPATLRFAVVEPGAFGFKVTESARDEKGFAFAWSFGSPETWQRSTVGIQGTVVLLHGFGESSLSMLPWAFALAQSGWRVVLLDARGHGRSSGVQVGYGVYEADDLIAVIAELRRAGLAPGRLALVGVSYGAHVAMLAAERGVPLAGVVAISGYPDPRAVIPRAARRFTRTGDWYDDDTYEDALQRTTALLGRPLAAAVVSGDAGSDAPPLLLIHGEKDAVALLADASALAKAWPGAELMVLPGADHIEPTLPDDARVARVVGFLDRLP